jgi:hypothetical protein
MNMMLKDKAIIHRQCAFDPCKPGSMKIEDVRKSLKKNRLLFFVYKKLTDRDYKTNYKDYLIQKNSIPPEKIRRELAIIKEYWQCDPMHYFRYRLYEKNLTYDELIDYIPPYYFYNFHLPSIYKNSDVSFINSKMELGEFFAAKDIFSPSIIGSIKKGKFLGSSGKVLSYDELLNLMSNSENELYFFKPDKGSGGRGIFIVRKNGKEFMVNDQKPLSEKLLKERTGEIDFVIQEGLKQSDDVNAIYPHSINTLRVVTQTNTGTVRLAAVVLRIGRNGSFVDNATQGGISVEIDPDSGLFKKYAFTEHSNEKFDTHPNTNFRFEGNGIKNWSKIKSDMLSCAEKVPELPEIAWDFAILRDRTAVIEINLDYGIDHLQLCIGGMRRELNVLPAY